MLSLVHFVFECKQWGEFLGEAAAGEVEVRLRMAWAVDGWTKPLQRGGKLKARDVGEKHLRQSENFDKEGGDP